MKKQYFTLLAAALSIGYTACAQTKKSRTASVAPVKHIESTTRRTLPGRPEQEPQTDIRHVIIWQDKKAPDAFFWRNEDAWMPCNVAKAHKTTPTSPNVSSYTSEEVRLEQVKKGDTLELTPMPLGKYGMPENLPKTARNTIFYKTTNSKWLMLPVTNFRKLPDIVMP